MRRRRRHAKYTQQYVFLPRTELITLDQAAQLRAEGVVVQEVLAIPGSKPIDGEEPFGVLFWADPPPERRVALQALITWIQANEVNFTLTWELVNPLAVQAELMLFVQPVQRPESRVILRFALPEWEIALCNALVATELIFFLCPAPQHPAPHELPHRLVTYEVVQRMVLASHYAALTFSPDQRANDGLLQLLTGYAMVNPASRLRDRLVFPQTGG